MTGFSATDAALEGFRITRDRPRALLAWTLFCFAVSVASVLITLLMPPEARDALESLQSDPSQTPTPEALLKTLTILSPVLLFGLAVQCVMAAAVYRIILRPADGKFSYLRLGRDELRLMALTMISPMAATVGIVLIYVPILLLVYPLMHAGAYLAWKDVLGDAASSGPPSSESLVA